MKPSDQAVALFRSVNCLEWSDNLTYDELSIRFESKTMTTHRIWNLKYVVGNPEVFKLVRTEAGGPYKREEALILAERVAGNGGGWRVWVEHVTSGERIFESNAEKLYRKNNPSDDVRLSPGEMALVESIIEHIYPEPREGRTLPVARSEMRAARGLARKGLVCIHEGDERVEMTFTALGERVYHRHLQNKVSKEAVHASGA